MSRLGLVVGAAEPLSWTRLANEDVHSQLDRTLGAPAGPGASIRGRPVPRFDAACPRCGASLEHGDVIFAGMPILVECRCAACAVEYMLHWPAGHALLHPTIVDLDAGRTYFDGSDWYPRAVERTLASRAAPLRGRVSVVRGGRPRARTAVVVDCLDYVYGHCVLKLLSAVRHVRDPDVDVVVVVQKNVSWLVPEAVHTVVEVDVPLREGDRWVDGLDPTLKRLVSAYETVRIAPTPSQPGLRASDLELAGPGLAPTAFWEERREGPPQITFLLREDRLWSGRSEPLLHGYPRLPLPPRLRRRLDLRRQAARYATVVRQVRAALPEARFAAIGLGRAGGLPAVVRDLRKTSISPRDELEWCAEYARSDVVVGVHGSHMLLPSALAGAVVELLPRAKLRNLAQDLIIAGEAESEPKLALYRYRILPEETRPSTVSEVVVSILDFADRHHLNVVRNRAAIDGWQRPIAWRPLAE